MNNEAQIPTQSSQVSDSEATTPGLVSPAHKLTAKKTNTLKEKRHSIAYKIKHTNLESDLRLAVKKSNA